MLGTWEGFNPCWGWAVLGLPSQACVEGAAGTEGIWLGKILRGVLWDGEIPLNL